MMRAKGRSHKHEAAENSKVTLAREEEGRQRCHEGTEAPEPDCHSGFVLKYSRAQIPSGSSWEFKGYVFP